MQKKNKIHSLRTIRTDGRDTHINIIPDVKHLRNMQLASCLIYARAFVEYVCGCVLFQDVTVCEIRRR